MRLSNARLDLFQEFWGSCYESDCFPGSFSAYLSLMYKKVNSVGRLMGLEISILREVTDLEKLMLHVFFLCVCWFWILNMHI